MRLICVLALASLSIPAIGDEQKLFDLLSKRLEAAEQAERWSDAIALTHQIIRRCPTEDYLREGRLADIGKFQLKLLDFEAAERTFHALLDNRTNPRRIGGAEELIVTLGLARIAAARGEYANALDWLRKFGDAFGSGCGNCGEGRDKAVYVHQIVWRAGLKPPAQAKAELTRIIAGDIVPRGGRIWNGPDLISRGVISRFLVLPFRNVAGPEHESIVDTLTRDFMRAARGAGKVTFFGPDVAASKARELKLEWPLTESGQQTVAKALGAEALVLGELKLLHPAGRPNNRNLQAGVWLNAYHVAGGGELAGAAKIENLPLDERELITDSIKVAAIRLAAVSLAAEMIKWWDPPPDSEIERIRPKDNPDRPLDPHNDWQKDMAASEARLMLAEILIREGRTREASEHLKSIETERHGASPMARAYLRRMGVR